MGGFVVRVLPTGKKVFLVRRMIDGKYRREKIGPLGPSLGVEEARRQVLRSGPPGKEAAPIAEPPTPTVAELLGHSSLKTTQIYAHAKDHRRSAIDLLAPPRDP